VAPEAQRLSDPRAVTLGQMLRATGAPGELELPDGEIVRIGAGPPAFRVVLRTDRLLREPLTELSVGTAYVDGDLDLEGDLMPLLGLRDVLPFGMPLGQRLRLAAELLLPPTWVNAQAIDHHYSFGDDFYLTFLDDKYHFYSQCLFPSGDETLDEAAVHKLERMWSALQPRPGMRLLDIGGGWGGLAEYCAQRGVAVTSLTLTETSAEFIRARVAGCDPPARAPVEVLVEDLLDHYPSRPYDHAVIYGVIEHIPNYRRFCERVWSALRPGGRLYLDASATKEKYAASPFTREFTWRGPHSCLALQDLVEELLFHGFEVLEVRQETRDYELTMTHWAQRLDAARATVGERWGEELYRAFRIFLWGGAHAFRTNRLQAYSLVAQRRDDPGPRPGGVRRLGHFLASLR
jgi:cyclopropane-fatty-acyl-phospholipid synthase